jgi:murein DD-endopeptidase MepM/ murein hydrolase activator NlpD
MLIRDDRFFAFIVAHTSRSRSRFRRIAIHKNWLKVTAALALIGFCLVAYGFYGLVRQAQHLQVQNENARLRRENENQRRQLEALNHRVEAVEDASRRLVELTGGEPELQSSISGGLGGPSLPIGDMTIGFIDSRTGFVEMELKAFEAILKERVCIPSIWPVRGDLESGFGGRRNPFGGSSYEYHEGQDIDAEFGTQVSATASGTVLIAGTQNGYGQVVYIDHGGGLTTRYGHLSRINVVIGQSITRGDVVGLVGSSGRSTGPHLHYEVRINNEPVDPVRYLPVSN